MLYAALCKRHNRVAFHIIHIVYLLSMTKAFIPKAVITMNFPYELMLKVNDLIQQREISYKEALARRTQEMKDIARRANGTFGGPRRSTRWAQEQADALPPLPRLNRTAVIVELLESGFKHLSECVQSQPRPAPSPSAVIHQTVERHINYKRVFEHRGTDRVEAHNAVHPIVPFGNSSGEGTYSPCTFVDPDTKDICRVPYETTEALRRKKPHGINRWAPPAETGVVDSTKNSSTARARAKTATFKKLYGISKRKRK